LQEPGADEPPRELGGLTPLRWAFEKSAPSAGSARLLVLAAVFAGEAAIVAAAY
jgi:hypothetical protein